MTRRDTLQCVHEPFGDAYYFGPERLAERYEGDEQARKESGYSQSTYRTIFDRIAKDNSEVRTSPCFEALCTVFVLDLASIMARQSTLNALSSVTSALALCCRVFLFLPTRVDDFLWLHCASWHRSDSFVTEMDASVLVTRHFCLQLRYTAR
jgi:hypothetical protein